MSSEEKVWCIIFSPKKTSDPIQGIRLRETVKAIALFREPKIFGRIRNIPNNQVEMVCKSDSQDLKKFLKEIETEIRQSTGVELIHVSFPADQLEKWVSFDTFSAEKSGQMEEMELAIRGAEFLFRKMYKQMVEFHRTDQINKLDGLEYDLSFILNWIEDGTLRSQLHQLKSGALSSYLVQPFDKNLTRVCKEINQIYIDHIIKKGASSFTDDELGNLSKLAKNALEIVSNLKESFEKEKDNKTKREE